MGGKTLQSPGKQSPTIPVLGPKVKASHWGRVCQGVDRALAAPLAFALQSVLRINPEAGRITLSQTSRTAHSMGLGGCA